MSLARLLKIAVLGLAAAGTLAVLIGFAGRWHWFADLFTHLRPQYCIGLGIVCALAFALRQRVAAYVALAGWLINGAALVPNAKTWATPESSATSQRRTFVSINLLKGNREPARVIRYLEEARPDIVVFQEVTDRLAKELEPLHGQYPYRVIRSGKEKFGIALFAREPPIEKTVEIVGNRVRNAALFARWESAGHSFALAVVHADTPDKEWKTVNRKRYFGHVARWVDESRKRGDAVIVLGDFNATPWSHSLQTFLDETHLRNAHEGRIFCASWSVWQPHQLLIDHALLSEDWALHGCEIGPDVGSDHRPIFVRVSLKR
jgi:endonuclease/exonuclease/phosphatase (EEP) superfamily protein YafD